MSVLWSVLAGIGTVLLFLLKGVGILLLVVLVLGLLLMFCPFCADVQWAEGIFQVKAGALGITFPVFQYPKPEPPPAPENPEPPRGFGKVKAKFAAWRAERKRKKAEEKARKKAAAAAAKAGVASIVAADAAEAAEKAAHIVGLLPANNLTGPAIFEFEQPTAVLAAGAEPAKAAAAVIDKDSAVELYAGFGKSVYTAFATIGGNAVGVVATGKQLCHNCVAKASRFVRLCDAFSVPVVTIVDTEGFVPSVTDDVAGGIREAARLAATYADATTAKVAVLAGKAVGPVYTTLAAADLRIAVTGCTVSALEPSAAVSVLYKDEIDASDNIIAATKAKAAAYTAEVCSAASAVAAGAADMSCDAANVRASVVAALELLSTKRAARLPKKHGNMAL